MKSNKNKGLLILVPSYSASGGIKNYYQILENKFSIPVDYFVRGARNWPYRKGKIREIFRAINDLVNFLVQLSRNNYGAIQTSTSLGSLGIIRDGCFIIFSRLFKKRIIVFFRGWDLLFEEKLDNGIVNWIFCLVFFKADCIIVLTKRAEKKLREWGYSKKIYLETTIVDENLISGINEEYLQKKYRKIKKDINILYLSRVEVPKGIYEALRTYLILKKEYENLTLTIAGDGFELDNAKKFTEDNSLANVHFTGYISGKDKISAYKNAHIYIFPSYTEGMPNSVLEAMAFGLPIITRAVGGLTIFFRDGINGYITDSKKPEVFSDLIRNLIKNKELLINMSVFNHQYAIENFITTKVVKRLEKIYKDSLNLTN